MINYQSLAAKPGVFKSITGLTVDEFDRLFQKFLPVWVEQERKRPDRPDRQRAIGGGRKYKLSPHNSPVMVLTWSGLYLNRLWCINRATTSASTALCFPTVAAGSIA